MPQYSSGICDGTISASMHVSIGRQPVQAPHNIHYAVVISLTSKDSQTEKRSMLSRPIRVILSYRPGQHAFYGKYLKMIQQKPGKTENPEIQDDFLLGTALVKKKDCILCVLFYIFLRFVRIFEQKSPRIPSFLRMTGFVEDDTINLILSILYDKICQKMSSHRDDVKMVCSICIGLTE